MSDELRNIQKQLNSAESVAGEIYRRNEINYPLVCYVNNITGCYISDNFETVVMFIGRAREHMKKNQEKPREEGYYSLVEEYISKMETHLRNKDISTEYPF